MCVELINYFFDHYISSQFNRFDANEVSIQRDPEHSGEHSSIQFNGNIVSSTQINNQSKKLLSLPIHSALGSDNDRLIGGGWIYGWFHFFHRCQGIGIDRSWKRKDLKSNNLNSICIEKKQSGFFL